MTYPASKLIEKSYYLSQIVARGIQTLNSDQIETGLDVLNFLLAVKSMDTKTIPFYTEYVLTPVVGQEKYFIPGLVEIETFTFNIGTVRYPSQELSRGEYFQTARADSVNALPFSWHIERAYETVLGVPTIGSNIFVYFKPSQNFPIKIWGKFSLQNVTLQSDLSLVYDLSYIEYLRHQLAVKLCAEWDQSVTSDLLQALNIIEGQMRGVNPPDLAAKRLDCYGDRATLNYAQINIGQGAVPCGL